MRLDHLRKEYRAGALLESRAPADPLQLFATWFDRAVAQGGPDRNAMTLATADGRGRPDARTVLLKSFDARGFVFATNYQSRKGREIEANPFATLLFYFPALEQQIRIEGRIARVSAAESDEIFMARPRGSRIGAMASPQSRVIANRKVVESRVAALEKKLASVEITRPAHWGGYRVKPRVIEFWQGRENRLHDRLRYTKTPRGWTRVRLAP